MCFAGGLGMNALLVRALERSGKFARVFVQPAAGNAGTALGAVLHAWHSLYRETKRVPLGNLCLGPSYSAEQIKQVLENCKLRFRYLLTTDEVIDAAVGLLGENKILAWMHGRMEFGPRALGNRSILASPLDTYSTENLNQYIKHREAFRKFAASVPAELAAEYFEVGENARFLATVGQRPPGLPGALSDRDSGGRPGPRTCRRRGRQSAVLETAARRRQVDRPAGALQHVVQPVPRSAGLHAARRRAQLLFLRHRRDVRGEFPAAEVIV